MDLIVHGSSIWPYKKPISLLNTLERFAELIDELYLIHVTNQHN